MQSVYFAVPADWATGHSLEKRSYLLAEMQSVYSAAPADWATAVQHVNHYTVATPHPLLFHHYDKNRQTAEATRWFKTLQELQQLEKFQLL